MAPQCKYPGYLYAEYITYVWRKGREGHRSYLTNIDKLIN